MFFFSSTSINCCSRLFPTSISAIRVSNQESIGGIADSEITSREIGERIWLECRWGNWKEGDTEIGRGSCDEALSLNWIFCLFCVARVFKLFTMMHHFGLLSNYFHWHV